MSDYHQQPSCSKAEKNKILEAFLSNQVVPEDWLLEELMEEIMPSHATEPKIPSSESSSKQESSSSTTSSTPTSSVSQASPTDVAVTPPTRRFVLPQHEIERRVERHHHPIPTSTVVAGKIEKPAKMFRKYRGSEQWKEALVKKLEEMDPSQCHDKSKKVPYEHLLGEFTLK